MNRAVYRRWFVSFAIVVFAKSAEGADDDLVAPDPALPSPAADIVPMSIVIPQSITSALQDELRYKVDELRANYDLTETQQTRLRFAGKSDVQKTTEQLKDRHEPRIVRDKLCGLFGRGSFMSKALPRILTPDQLAKYQSDRNDRLQLRHRSDVEGAIRDIERSVVLSIEQHEALVATLMCELRPLQVGDRWGETVVKYRRSRLPEGSLRPVFNDRQWDRVRAKLADYQQLGNRLRRELHFAGLAQNAAGSSDDLDELLDRATVTEDLTPIDESEG